MTRKLARASIAIERWLEMCSSYSSTLDIAKSRWKNNFALCDLLVLATAREIRIFGDLGLSMVDDLNRQGRFVIFAPNHIRPKSKLCRRLELVPDYPVLRACLYNNDIENVPVVTGDMNIRTFGNRTLELLYVIQHNVFRFYFSITIPGAITGFMNLKEPAETIRRNVGILRKMMRNLQRINLVVFPYAHWYDPGQQRFESERSLPGGNFVDIKRPEHEDFSIWRNSLKSGVFTFAQEARTPIVPVFLHTERRIWWLQFGKPIEVSFNTGYSTRETALAAAHQYVKEMSSLRYNTIKRAGLL